MSFTEQDMKKQMEDFAALREEFSRLESQEKAMRKQLGLSEQEKTDPATLTPELRCRRHPRRRPPEYRPPVGGRAAGFTPPVPNVDFLLFQQGIIIKEYI